MAGGNFRTEKRTSGDELPERGQTLSLVCWYSERRVRGFVLGNFFIKKRGLGKKALKTGGRGPNRHYTTSEYWRSRPGGVHKIQSRP